MEYDLLLSVISSDDNNLPVKKPIMTQGNEVSISAKAAKQAHEYHVISFPFSE